MFRLSDSEREQKFNRTTSVTERLNDLLQTLKKTSIRKDSVYPSHDCTWKPFSVLTLVLGDDFWFYIRSLSSRLLVFEFFS